MNQYEIGTPVYFYTWLDRIPGEVQSISENDGKRTYDICLCTGAVAKNASEDMIAFRKIIESPRYKKGDVVRFKHMEKILTGTISIVDAYGTMEQDEEPSYDIMVEEPSKCLYKHTRESWVVEKMN